MGVWSSRISGTSSDSGSGIAVDSSGDSYVTGSYTSPATIYNSDGTAFRTLSGSGSSDAFIVKYGSTGMGVWSSRISGVSNDGGSGIAVDSSGNIYVTGGCNALATIYNSDGTAFQTIVNGNGFVVKYGSTGMGSWVSRINSGINGIAIDSSGNSYVTGTFSTSTTLTTIFNSDGTTFQNISGLGSTDAFIVKYGSTGMGSWVSRIGGVGAESGNGIAVDSSGNIYVAGSYSSSPATIYNSDGTSFRTISGIGITDFNNPHAFIVKFNNGPDSISSYYLIDLDNIESNNGKTVIISNKVYQAGFILNVQTQSFVTYLTANVSSSIHLVFFNGSWIVTSQS